MLNEWTIMWVVSLTLNTSVLGYHLTYSQLRAVWAHTARLVKRSYLKDVEWMTDNVGCEFDMLNSQVWIPSVLPNVLHLIGNATQSVNDPHCPFVNIQFRISPCDLLWVCFQSSTQYRHACAETNGQLAENDYVFRCQFSQLIVKYDNCKFDMLE